MNQEQANSMRLIEICTPFEPQCKQRKLVDASLSLSDLQLIYGRQATISFVEQTPNIETVATETILGVSPKKAKKE
jgi:hypothetical protein